MRALCYLALLIAVAGCTTSRSVERYTYSPPVVVKLKSLPSGEEGHIAYFTVTNVSTEPMWYLGDGRDVDHYVEWKSHSWYGPERAIDDTCTGWPGAEQHKLAAGDSMTFRAILGRHPQEPFRVGIWLSPEADNRAHCDLIYWSDFVSP